MAGIRSKESPKPAEYDVFLSFRGKDTRNTFTSCLYHDLVGAGIRVFRDEEELSKGKYIGSELLKAIANSRICMPILSPNFATSAWCLREVAHMVQCRQQSGGTLWILPIFYNVDVADVKLRTGSTYEVHINQHRDRFEEETLLLWKDALKDVAKIKGWNLKDDTDHGELIKSIVRDILIKLRNKDRNVPCKFVERQDEVDTLMRLIDVDSEGVRFIVIHGMGGIGKTTLANVVFNQLYSHYEGSSFLESVREGAERHGHLYLQQKLLSDILNHDFTRGFSDINDGINNIRRKLCTKKVLIVVDDVDEDNQLKDLARESGWFGTGSRIIITTRNRGVLPMQGEDGRYYFYELRQLQLNDALRIFSWHAFGRDCPPDDCFDVLSRKIVTAMGGHPLALEVIGSSLFCRCLKSCECKKIWEETLKKLSVPSKKVEDMLMISIQKLNFEQKQIFLDIASIFINEDTTNAIYMWGGSDLSPYMNINLLMQMSLIKITDSNKFWMHDILRDLGRQICKGSRDNPRRCSRVWNEWDAKEIIKKKQGLEFIEVLYLNLDESLLTQDALAKLENLRFLKLRQKFKEHHISFLPKNEQRSEGNIENLFSNLRWLRWHQLPSDLEVVNLRLSNLVVLELCYSDITEDWKGWRQLETANKLKVLDLTGCKQLERTPDFSSFLLLERLILQGCRKLVEINPSIGKLVQLTYLNLEGCRSLRKLPEEVGFLTSLTTIIMKGDQKKFELPNSMGSLSSLTSLEIRDVSIAKLPDSVGELTNLNHLSLTYCKDLKELPNSIGNLESLIELDITGSGIKELPDSIKNLESLKVIKMNATPITRFPADIGLLKSLEMIHAIECFWLKGEIPSSINNLSHLKELQISLSQDFKMELLPMLPSCLNALEIEARLTDVAPDLSYLSNLTDLRLNIYGTQRTDFQSIGKLSKLKRLIISHLYVITLGDEIASLIQLEYLELCCKNLEYPLQLPSGLQSLCIHESQLSEGPPLAVSIPCLEKLQMLHNFSVHSYKFCDLDGLHLLRNLRKLTIDGHRKRCPDLSSLENLTHLELSNCYSLSEIGLGKLQLLEDLRIERCHSLVALCGLSNLISLKQLIIDSCRALKDVEGLDKLTSLVYLMIQGCPMKTLPNISLLDGQLAQLIINCPNLPKQYRDS